MKYERITLDYEGNKAILTTYIIDNSEEIDPIHTRPMVIICPGGGYQMISEREGEPIAIQMNAMGFHSAVLTYSIKPSVFPTAMNQLAMAVAYAREHSNEWHVDVDKIILCGFSAGGHLAASLGVLWTKDEYFLNSGTTRQMRTPNGMILGYPVITSGVYGEDESFNNLLGKEYEQRKQELSLELKVDEDTAPTFLWHTVTDQIVPVENSMLMAWKLQEKHIPFELHLYPRGRHGLALANEETGMFAIQKECQNWIKLVRNWVQNL